jgi:hypothetical protein
MTGFQCGEKFAPSLISRLIRSFDIDSAKTLPFIATENDPPVIMIDLVEGQYTNQPLVSRGVPFEFFDMRISFGWRL